LVVGCSMKLSQSGFPIDQRSSITCMRFWMEVTLDFFRSSCSYLVASSKPRSEIGSSNKLPSYNPGSRRETPMMAGKKNPHSLFFCHLDVPLHKGRLGVQLPSATLPQTDDSNFTPRTPGETNTEGGWNHTISSPQSSVQGHFHI
jgi:hypothetical protein